MELDLRQTVLERYCTVLETVVTREEVSENIVPDALPDAARLISVDCAACINGKECTAGTVRLTGALTVTALYLPDGGGDVTTMTVKQPFQCSCDTPQITGDCQAQASVLSVIGSGKLLNPRKLFLKGELRVLLRVYAPERSSISSAVAVEEKDIQQRCQSCQDHAAVAVLEKPFLFSDVLRPSASRPPMETLLSAEVQTGVLDAKYIGRRLICKGVMTLSALYLSAGQTVCVEFELPYSQVMDFEGDFEDGEPDTLIALQNVSCRLSDGELEVTVEALLQAVLWRSRQVTALCDLYSTKAALDTEYCSSTLCTHRVRESRHESVHQFCPLDVPAKQVLRCTAAVLSVEEKTGAAGLCYEAEAELSVLCLSESGTLYTSSCLLQVSCAPECGQAYERHCCCTCADTSAVPVTGGLELRLEMEFIITAQQQEEIQTVCAVRESGRPQSKLPRPSVILRPVRSGEILWDLAKACGAAAADIRTVNQMDSDEIQPGQLLLIPTVRP